MPALASHPQTRDRQTREEAEPHLLWLFQRGLKMPLEFPFTPGYMTLPSMMRLLTSRDKADWGTRIFEELSEQGHILVESPKTVTEQRIRAAVSYPGRPTGADGTTGRERWESYLDWVKDQAFLVPTL